MDLAVEKPDRGPSNPDLVVHPEDVAVDKEVHPGLL